MLQKDNSDRRKEIRESQQIPLWSEKLTVNCRQRKVGEVIVRKQVETRMIQVPIKEEKLIIERIGENPEQLAEVVINTNQVNGVQLNRLAQENTLHLTKSHYLSVEMAQNLLKAIALLPSAAKTTVRLEVISDSSEKQIEHQQICDRYSIS
jgi:stress response protein YsnF